MKRAWAAIAVVVMLGLAIIAVNANVIGHVQAGRQPDQPGDEPENTGYRPPMPPDREDPLDRLIWDAEVMPPHEYGGLTLFPIELRDRSSEFRPRTFDEAIDRDELDVREIGEGRVNEVQVRNIGRQPVFVMAGEIMSGSKQDRISSADVLIPPRSGWISLDVYCVEHGRWEKTSDKFQSRRSLANAAIRQMAQAAAPQTDIWEGVQEKARAAGVEQSGRGAFNEIYDSESVQERLRPYRRKLGDILTHRTAGVAAVSRGQIIALDIFANPEMLAKMWDKLLDSYSLDAFEYAERDRAPELSRRDIEAFLRSAASDRAGRSRMRTPGIGSMFSLESGTVQGFMLSYDDEVVHASFFQPRVQILDRGNRDDRQQRGPEEENEQFDEGR